MQNRWTRLVIVSIIAGFMLSIAITASAQDRVSVTGGSEAVTVQQIFTYPGMVDTIITWSGRGQVIQAQARISDRLVLQGLVRHARFGDTLTDEGPVVGTITTMAADGSTGGYKQYRIAVGYKLAEGVTIGGGYRQTEFAKDLVGIAVGGIGELVQYHSGTSYTYVAPVAEVSARRSFRRLSVEANVAYAPWQWNTNNVISVFGPADNLMRTQTRSTGLDYQVRGNVNLYKSFGVSAGWTQQFTSVRQETGDRTHESVRMHGFSVVASYALR